MRPIASARLFAAFALLCMGYQIAAAPTPSPAPEVHVGDTWKYRNVDGFTEEVGAQFTHRVVEVNDREIVIQLRNSNGVKSALRYFNHEWNPIDVGETKYDPYYPEFKFPISAGMAWNQKFTSSTSDGNGNSGYVTAKVSSLEKVTVPAGTFDAYRIERNVETRAANASATVTKWQITTWYAPTAKKFVRRESVASRDGRVRSHTIDELTEYTLDAKTVPALSSMDDGSR
jgi:hypothetical protein